MLRKTAIKVIAHSTHYLIVSIVEQVSYLFSLVCIKVEKLEVPLWSSLVVGPKSI